MEPIFFKTPAEMRKWLQKNYKKETEIIVGYYKVSTGKPSITWSESVDQAICFGWIDGVRRSIDEASYMIRFTPRKAKSIWSAVNIEKVKKLAEAGLMLPEGLAAFEKREDAKSKIYSFEQEKVELDAPSLKKLKANKKAWLFFDKETPGSYKRAAIWWVISAKQETTKARRLQQLIDDSEAGKRLKHLTPIKTKK